MQEFGRILKFLIHHGANLELEAFETPHLPLHAAVQYGQRQCVYELVRAGAETKARVATSIRDKSSGELIHLRCAATFCLLDHAPCAPDEVALTWTLTLTLTVTSLNRNFNPNPIPNPNAIRGCE